MWSLSPALKGIQLLLDSKPQPLHSQIPSPLEKRLYPVSRCQFKLFKYTSSTLGSTCSFRPLCQQPFCICLNFSTPLRVCSAASTTHSLTTVAGSICLCVISSWCLAPAPKTCSTPSWEKHSPCSW